MEMIPIKPERKAQLEQDQREYDETVQGALRGYEDVKAGRTSSADEVFDWLRAKHGL